MPALAFFQPGEYHFIINAPVESFQRVPISGRYKITWDFCFLAGVVQIGALIQFPGGIAGVVQERWQAYLDRRAEAPLAEHGRVDAVVYDAPVLLYYAAHDGNGKVQPAGSIFRKEKYAVVFPSDSRYRKPVNEALLRLEEYCRNANTEIRNRDEFLARTVRNLSIDQIRHERVVAYAPDPVEEVANYIPLIDCAPTPDRVLDAEQRLSEVGSALAKVKPGVHLVNIARSQRFPFL